MGIFVENVGGDFLHQAAHNFENDKAGGDDGGHHDEVGRGEENEFEEIADERDSEGGNHNANDRDKEAGAELIERPGDPVDEDEVDSEGDEDRDGGEFWMRKTLEVGGDREGGHTERDGDANWEGISEDVFGEVVFDAVGVFFEGEDKAREADTGEV